MSKKETAFDIFAEEQKEKLKDKDLEGSVDDEITKLWADLSDKDKEPYQDKAVETNKKNAEAEAEAEAEEEESKKESKSEEPVKKETQDEDVEMTNYDTEEQETQDKDGDE